MKQSTTNTLITAKSIYRELINLVNAGDKHSATSAIILLQDCVELIILGALDELDADEQRNLASKSFDELLGELKKQGVPVVKSGTMKALNKQRILCKHYGQLAEPASVVSYLSASDTFIDTVLNHVLGKPLAHVFLIDMIKDCPAKNYLQSAIVLSERNIFLDALIEIRKAFFTAYESFFSVYGWRNQPQNENAKMGILQRVMLGGDKAPYWTKSREWIQQNVNTPCEYIQMDLERLRIDCMEWGLSTAEIENLRRLTPAVVETEKDQWHVEYDFSYPPNEANLANFNYCLDIAINFLLKKQEFEDVRKWPKNERAIPAPPIYIGKSLYQRPIRTSPIVHVVQEGYYYSIDRTVTGFNNNERYQYIHLYQIEDGTNHHINHVWGYLPIE